MRTIGLMLAIGGLCAACGGSGASVAFDVAVEALDSAPAAGVAASFQVRVLNDDRSVATGFTGTVALTSSDPAAVFDSVLAFTAASGGVAVLDVVFRTAGPQTLVVDAGGDPASVAVNVVPAAATSFLVDVSDDQPSGKNRPMNGVATATALDAFGNVVTDFSALTDPVTLRVESGNVAVAGLGGVNADTLSSTDDFVEGTATLHGRVVLQGVASAARLVLESATGATGRSGAFSIDTMGPVPAAAALLLDVNRTGAIDQGDQLTLAFDEDLVVDGATPNDIALNDPGDDLGLGATVELGPAAHQLKITLGAGATLRPEGLASGIAVRATNAIASAATGAPVESGAPADVVPFPVQGPTFTTAGELRGVARGDFDGDGDLDLAVAAYHRDGRVLLNDGAAGFTEHMRVAVSSAQGRVASGDLDGDGDVDLVFASGNRGRIFVNDGAGTFTFARHTPLPVGIPVGNLTDIVLGDLDNDGDLDLVVTNRHNKQIVYANTGTGIFVFQDSVGSGYCERAALHDMDNDGFRDIVLATVVAGPDGVAANAADEVWRNDGSAKFTKLTDYGLVQRTWGIAVGDLDGDGHADIVAGDQDDMRVYRNDGDGASFTLVATLESRTFPFEIRLADLDGDGHLDLLSMRGFWMNEGDGKTFRFVAELSPRPRGRGSLITGDFDGDGRRDVVVVNSKVIDQTGSPSIVYFGASIR